MTPEQKLQPNQTTERLRRQRRRLQQGFGQPVRADVAPVSTSAIHEPRQQCQASILARLSTVRCFLRVRECDPSQQQLKPSYVSSHLSLELSACFLLFSIFSVLVWGYFVLSGCLLCGPSSSSSSSSAPLRVFARAVTFKSHPHPSIHSTCTLLPA